MDAKATIGMELSGAACILGLTAFRLYIQRKRPRRKVGAFYAYEICLWFALATNLYITGMDVWSSWREVKANFPKGTSQKELSKHLIDSKFMKAFFAGGICYTHFLWFVKGSFIAVYFEISGHFVKRVRWMLYGVTAFVVVTYFINILMKFLWCLPFERNWSLGPDKCTFAIAMPVNTCTAFFNIATDLALLGFFIVVVNSLQLENREVIAAIFVGAIGACTVAAAAVRFGVAYTSFKDSEASWRNTKRLLLWTNVEMGLVFVAVTLPAFRVIFRKRTGNTSSHGYGYSAEFPNKSLHGELGIATELSIRPRTAKMKKSATSSVVIPSVSSDRDLERPLRDDKTRSESSENLCPPNLIAHAR